MANDWSAVMPVYVTRTNSDTETGTLSMSIWMAMLVMLLVWLNIIGWSVYGLVELVSKVI